MTHRDHDEDAAWRSIIEHYGERPTLPPVEPVETPPVEPSSPVEPPRSWVEPPRSWVELPRSWVEPVETDDEHFVPPDPPPPPQPQGIRKWAWIGLFGSPAVMLTSAVLAIDLWDWVLFTLVASFVGGFIYLVATMKKRPPDDWSGDNGAVV